MVGWVWSRSQTKNNRFVLRPHRPAGRPWTVFNLCLAGTFVIEYCGEIVDIPEAHRRLETSASEGVTNYYILALDKVFSIRFVA